MFTMYTLTFVLPFLLAKAELWEKDMTEEIYIAASTEGFELVRY